MTWRSIFISQPASLSLKNQQLEINQEIAFSVPLEDIGAIMIDSPQVTLTARLLSELGAAKIPVFFCDEKHLPCTLVLPFHQHSRQKKILTAQLEATLPFKKKCWQKIVQQKIINQATCLTLCNRPKASEIEALASKVTSGDKANKEAHAAQLYFPQMFPGSHRRADTITNSALNYGYAILRGLIARGITAYGLLPAIGLHHHGELNPFNLADDLLEPFRPIVDLWVWHHCQEQDEFTSAMRTGLLGLLHQDIWIQGRHQTLLRAIDIATSQLAAAFLTKDPQKLSLPTLIPLSETDYE